MPAVPETKTAWVNNVDPLNSTNLNAYLRDPLRFLMRKPAATLRQSTGPQSYTSASFTPVTFNSEDIDDDIDGVGGHSTVTNTSRYTARYPGWYVLGGGCSFSANATGRRGVQWSVNGSAVNGSFVVLPAAAANETVVPARAMVVLLNEGDYVELIAYQNSGATLTAVLSGNHQPSMSVTWDRLA
ncbi:hypothetical protein ACIBBG_31965 [Micromonospora chersina]|uniref:hypothetical protein n=1 Tax=Micromonospora chersina TaxID=47854 RepID=UPI0037B8E5B6